jgi:hypothetical protein
MSIDCIFYKNGYHFTQIITLFMEFYRISLPDFTGILPVKTLNFTGSKLGILPVQNFAHFLISAKQAQYRFFLTFIEGNNLSNVP